MYSRHPQASLIEAIPSQATGLCQLDKKLTSTQAMGQLDKQQRRNSLEYSVFHFSDCINNGEGNCDFQFLLLTTNHLFWQI